MNEFDIRIKRGMIYILIANILTLIINLITNFLLPKYLSVNTYASIKTFQLYLNYVGVFHFGYVDGIYLRYGTNEDVSLSKLPQLNDSLVSLLIFQGVITVACIGLSLFVKDSVLLYFSFSILPYNLVGFIRILLQAVGKFVYYRKITNIIAITTFIINLIFIFLCKYDDYRVFLSGYIAVNAVIAFFIIGYFFLHSTVRKIRIKSIIFEIVTNTRLGIFLMLGNLSSFILSTMDRWFVKFTLDNFNFAMYSFAVSIENMLNLAISPVVIPLYNFFCREENQKSIRMVHKIICVFSSFLISSAYILAIFVSRILPKYSSSLQIVFWLFAGQSVQIVIKAVYINLYKVRKQQKKYFNKLVFVIVFGAVSNAVLFSLIKSAEAYAMGTFLCAIVWLILSAMDFAQDGIDLRDYIFVALYCLLFIVTATMSNPFCGLVLYCIGVALMCVLFMKEVCYWLLDRISHKIRA